LGIVGVNGFLVLPKEAKSDQSPDMNVRTGIDELSRSLARYLSLKEWDYLLANTCGNVEQVLWLVSLDEFADDQPSSASYRAGSPPASSGYEPAAMWISSPRVS
jgi:hypothetical protein